MIRPAKLALLAGAMGLLALGACHGPNPTASSGADTGAAMASGGAETGAMSSGSPGGAAPTEGAGTMGAAPSSGAAAGASSGTGPG